MGKARFVFTIVLLFLLLELLFCPSAPIWAQETNVYVNPPSLSEEVGQTFNVSISVTDVENLWAWNISLSFDPNLLEVQNIYEGEFLNLSGPTSFSVLTINNVTGALSLHDERTQPPSGGSSGSGTLVYIELYCNDPGVSLLHIFNTFLEDPEQNLISHTTSDGMVTQTLPPAASLPITFSENVTVSHYPPELPTADSQLTIEIPASPLADFYRETLAAPSNASENEAFYIPENRSLPDTVDLGENVTVEDLNLTGVIMPVRDDFYNSIAQEQESRLGFLTSIYYSYMVPNSTGNGTMVMLDAGLAFKSVSMTSVVTIDFGPANDDATSVAMSDASSKIALVQQMLESLPGNQVFDNTWVVRIVLPSEATPVNFDELNGLNWTIDFGGGTNMSASVSVAGPDQLVFIERTFVTEFNVTTSAETLFNAFSTYGKFPIIYQIPGIPPRGGGGGNDGDGGASARSPMPHLMAFEHGTGSNIQLLGMSTSPPKKTVVYDISGETGKDWSWSWSRTISPGSFTASLSSSSLAASLMVTPSLTLSGDVGWDFGWKGPWYSPKWGLNWFKASMTISPSATVTVTATITSSYSYSRDQTLYTWSNTYYTMFGIVPIWVDLDFQVTLSFNAYAQGTLSWNFGETVTSTFTAGVKWDGKWKPINQTNFSCSQSGPTISASAFATISPEVRFQLSALFYSTAGPFVAFVPYGKMTINVSPSKTWSVTLNFRIETGCTFADWLKRIVGLNDYRQTLYNTTLQTWNGSWSG